MKMYAFGSSLVKEKVDKKSSAEESSKTKFLINLELSIFKHKQPMDCSARLSGQNSDIS